jgi:hypothetical protein
MHHNEQTIRGISNVAQYEEKMRAAAEYERAQKGALLGGSALARDRSTLEVSMDSVSNGLDEACVALDRLAGRLHPVLQPESPASATAGMASGVSQGGLHSVAVSRLHGLRCQLESLVYRINDLSARLDT